jgi:uncharacterized protein
MPGSKPELPVEISRERHVTEFLRRMIRTPLGKLVYALSHLVYPQNRQNWVEIQRVQYHLPRLAEEFRGYRIAQISDFHFGTWFTRPHLEQVVALVNREKPDLIALTGDFVTSEPEQYGPILTELLTRLSYQDAGVFVLGNHDHWTDPGVVRAALTGAGLIDLSNSVYSIRRGHSSLHIAGVDCYYDGLDRLDLVLEQLPEDGAAVLLAHEPDFADAAAASLRFDLQISGHSHGGQIRFPRLGSLFLPKYAKRYPQGAYQIGSMSLYTNRGLGTAELPIRLNCTPEITIYDLLPIQADSF